MTPSDSICCEVKPLIAACVATGMNVGNKVTPSAYLKRFSGEHAHDGPIKRPTSKFHPGHARSGSMTCRKHFELHPLSSSGQAGSARERRG